MTRFRRAALGVFTLAASCLPLQARSAGLIPPTLAGVPGEGLCTQCHLGTAANAGPGRLTLTLLRNGEPATSYTPGTRYTVRVLLQDPDAQRWGFMVSPRRADTSQAGGAVVITDPVNTQLRPGSNGIEGVAHTSDGNRAGTRNQSQWEFDWTAPASSVGPITFFAAGNAANFSADNQGDRIYTTTLQVMAAGDAPQVTQVLSRIAIGAFGAARFQSIIYLHNPNDTPASVTVNTYDMNGGPLAWAPDTGGGAAAIRTLQIPAGGSAVLRSQDAGAGLVGWARVTAPRGVAGYGVYRQAVAGKPDQEAVVPFTSDAMQSARILFDDVGSNTAVVITNPTETPGSATLTIKDENGQSLGTANFTISARSSVAGLLSNLAPGLAAAAGKRGAAVMTMNGGAISTAALRFLADAFGSIPVVSQ